MIAFWRDKYFVLALLAGPLIWIGLLLFGLHNTNHTPKNLNLLLPILVYPVIEEWFFRGTLQPALTAYPRLKKKWKALTLANVLTSVAFASLHLISQSPLWAILVFFPSLVFGWSMERYKTLFAPVVLHVFYNAGFFILL